MKKILLIACCLLAVVSSHAETIAPQHEKIADGDTQLSPYFSVNLSGGWVKPLTLRTYHHDKGEKTLVGLARFSEHASRQNGYALSNDGRTLLYFHQNLPEDKTINKPGGLYEFRHGEGDKRLHGFVSNAEYLPGQVPSNTIVFTKLIKKPTTLLVEGKVYLRDTEGNEQLVTP